MQCRVESATHDRGGTLDIVATRADLDAPEIGVLEVGISDHRLLRWTSRLERPPPVYHTSTYCPWRRVNVDEFKAGLRQSTLCADFADGDGDGDEDADPDSLDDLYTSVITSIADRLVPMRTVTCGRRASDVWFDDECRAARKKCRRLERRCNRSSVHRKQWQSEFRRYRQLTRRKRAEFWRTSIDENRSSPQRLWRSIDNLMGREKLAASPDITASDFHKFFVDKVAGVRAVTDGVGDPAFRQS